MHKPDLQSKRLYFSLVVGVPFVRSEFVLEYAFIRAEIIENILLYVLHLRGIDDIGLAVDLLYILVFLVYDENACRIVYAEIDLLEPLLLLLDIIRLETVSKLCNKAYDGAVLYAVDDALILSVDKVKRRLEADIAFAPKLRGVLELIDYPAAGG